MVSDLGVVGNSPDVRLMGNALEERFSRYMHIFTEIPLIFLRHYKLRSTETEGRGGDRLLDRRPLLGTGADSRGGALPASALL